MNRKTFIQSLRSGLNRMGIADADEVVRDYESHFDAELALGKTEAEIARELGDLRQILADFEPEKPQAKPAGRGVALTGLVVADFFLWMFFLVLILGIFIPIGLGIGGLGLGIYYVGGLDFITVFPAIPFPVSLLFGLAFLALGCWGFSATYFYSRFLGRILRDNSRWGRGILGKENPPSEVRPLSRFWKRAFALSGLAFAILAVAAYFLASVVAGNPEFWHVWHWFQ